MNCKKIHKILPDFIDGKLSVELADNVHEHIHSCTECNVLYGRLKNSLELLKPTKDIPEQHFYYTRLKQKMENKISVKESFVNIFKLKRIFQPVIYLASVIIAVFIGIQIGSYNGNNKYSDLNNPNESYVETFAKYSYINDIEIEPIESLVLEENTTNE